jgi:hypothetical protein
LELKWIPRTNIIKNVKAIKTIETIKRIEKGSLNQNSHSECQEEYGAQLTELIQRGYTWGYNYSIPVHAGDFKALQKKEWAAIRAIVKKQEYNGSLTNY